MADLLTTRQVTELLKIDRTTIYRMVENGQLPAIRVGKQWRFARTDIDRFLAAPPSAEPLIAAHRMVPTTATQGKQPVTSNTAQAPTQDQPVQDRPLQDLLPIQAVQMMQDLAADALSVTIVTTDMAGNPVTEVSNACGLYATLLNDDAAVSHCIQEWQQIAGLVTLEPKFLSNAVGLLCARGLIRSGNHLKGMVFFGGIAPEQWPPEAGKVTAIAEHFHLPLQVLTPRIDEVYHLDQGQRRQVLSYVQRLADTFSLLLEQGKE